MKFVQRDLGEAAEASSGGGDRGLFRELFKIILLVSATLAVIYFGVVFLTEAAVGRLSPQEEQELFGKLGIENFGGEEVPEALKEKFALCEQILDRLTEYEEVPEIDYELLYLPEILPNAFAVPGGKICLTRGLLNSLEEEISIAFVLGHELGHFAQRDHLRGLGRNLGFGIGVSILFGGNLDRATNLIMAKYSRGQESSADDFGIRAVLSIYGEAEGAEALFRILEEENAIPGWAYMFASHPDNQSRIRKILEARKAGE